MKPKMDRGIEVLIEIVTFLAVLAMITYASLKPNHDEPEKRIQPDRTGAGIII